MKNLFLITVTMLLLASCSNKPKQIPVIMVNDDFMLLDEPEMEYHQKDTTYYFMSIRDAETEKVKGYICIGRKEEAN